MVGNVHYLRIASIKQRRMYKYLIAAFCLVFNSSYSQELYKAPPEGTNTRWVSPENPSGAKGAGGVSNAGAKGNAFYIIAPGEKKVLFDVQGPGVVRRMWMSGSIAVNAEQRRAVRIDMYWDNAKKPAVSAPVGDFFGMGLGLAPTFQSDLFANPEGRSFNCDIPMPYRKSARIELTNESSYYVLYWFDIDYLQMAKPDNDAMYFHAYWNRTSATELGKDYEILPKVNGKGRFLGTNIGVIGNKDYNGTWFGEGEVKMYLDGDKELPSLVGTGTEDYIGSGWGQGVYGGRYQGSLIADNANDLYAFYRYHIADPVYFHTNCRVTIQQIGNAPLKKIREMMAKKAKIRPVWILDSKGAKDITKMPAGPAPVHVRLLDEKASFEEITKDFPDDYSTNFYRSDDVSATAYFYLDQPQSDLPALPPLDVRMKDLKERVLDRAEKK